MKHPFESLEVVEAPQNAKDFVRMRVSEVRRREARRAFIARAAGIALSVAAFVSSCTYLYNAAISSGFAQYIALILSDSTTALSFIRELSYALLESLPALALASVLATGFAFIRLSMSLFNPHGRLGTGRTLIA